MYKKVTFINLDEYQSLTSIEKKDKYKKEINLIKMEIKRLILERQKIPIIFDITYDINIRIFDLECERTQMMLYETERIKRKKHS